MTDTEAKSKGTIAVCTVMQNQVASRSYVNTLLMLSEALRSEGYSMSLYTVGEEDNSAKAKNLLVHSALKSNNLLGVLFINSSLGATPDDILSMIESEKNVIGALVPKTNLNWSSLKNAVLLKRDNLHLYSGNFSVKFIDEKDVAISYEEPFEVRNISDGLLYVSTKVFTDLGAHCNKYLNTYANGQTLEEEVVEYFKTSIDPDSKEFLAEDYNFCEMVRAHGGSVWAAPWIDTTVSGIHAYEGSFIHSVELLASIKELTKQ